MKSSQNSLETWNRSLSNQSKSVRGVAHPSHRETRAVDLPNRGGGRVAVSVGTGRYVKCGCSKVLSVGGLGR